MDDHVMSIEDEIKDASMKRPHVVILGAGASLAAFNKGDKNGRVLPVMNNLIETLNLLTVLKKHNIKFSEGENFESLYERISIDKSKVKAAREIETLVEGYFSRLVLPDIPTIYDHLILSLRKKDLIATFNWDPFLYNAMYRNRHVADLPHPVYLHGNVAIGYCFKDKIKGCNGTKCSVCKEILTPSPLLYPITKKNYTSNEYINSEWKTLESYLKSAYMVTIFGYSAPKTDIEALRLMKTAWGTPQERNLEEIEIIDIKPEDELVKSWEDFIHSHHYMVKDDFYNSWIAKHPRRTCDSLWNQNMNVKFIDENPLPKDLAFNELWQWYKPLLDVEAELAKL